MQRVRLDKLLSNRGYCSRNQVSKLIRGGVVLVNGEVPRSPDQKVDPQEVSFEGAELDPGPGIVVMLHKPCGYTCSRSAAEPLLYDLLPERFFFRNPKLVSVGRLDKDTSGLVLLTDDGDLLHRLTSPRHEVPKVYEAAVSHPVDGRTAELFASGTLVLPGDTKPLRPATLQVIEPTRVLVTVAEGRYHQVRRMFERVGNTVLKLHRLRIGALGLGGLPEGGFRLVSTDEQELLFSCALH